MRKLAFTFVAALAAVIVLWAVQGGLWQRSPERPEVGPYTLQTLDGQSLTSAELAGQVVVLDFWATWCVPCLKAFPKLDAFYAQYANNPKVTFLAVNIGDDTLEQARRFAASSGYRFPFAYDATGQLSVRLASMGIPTLCIIDPEGRLYFRQVGYTGGDYEATIGPKIAELLDIAQQRSTPKNTLLNTKGWPRTGNHQQKKM